MAEFAKIVKTALRMCEEADDCESCPLQNEDCAFAQNAQSDEALQRVERKVLQWAREHKHENVWYRHVEAGEWFGGWECTKCGKTVPELYSFCPGCGQKMEGEADKD